MAETKISQPQRTPAQRYMECKRIIEDTFQLVSCRRQRIALLRNDFMQEMLGRAYNSNWFKIFTRVAGLKGEELAFDAVIRLYNEYEHIETRKRSSFIGKAIAYNWNGQQVDDFILYFNKYG